ncbi:MAG: 50S ribosomal protein L10 [Eubacteriales bacterium]|jgi:large subunit ribosomal protein L10
MPSSKAIDIKKQIVQDLTEHLNGAVAGVVVDFSGVSVAQDTAMRAELRKSNVTYKVAKNTLIGRACDNVGLGDMAQYLNGNTAIAISREDPVIAAKILKSHTGKESKLEIKGGFYDGKVIDADMVRTLADTPTPEESIAKFLGSIQSSLYNFAYAIQAIVDRGEVLPASAAEATAEAAPTAE